MSNECRVLSFRDKFKIVIENDTELQLNELCCEIWKEQLAMQRVLGGNKIEVKNESKNSSL